MIPMDIHALVDEFYALEAIQAMLFDQRNHHFEPYRHSHGRWYMDFCAFRDDYNSKLAAAIFDYTVLVVAGELRHGKYSASHNIIDYYTNEVDRNKVYSDCMAYTAGEILEAGRKLFDPDRVKWKRSYGGEKWKRIACAGQMKGKVTDCIFIDHCVDLSHNNSNYFDKGANIFILYNRGQYASYLYQKRYCNPPDLLLERKGDRFHKLLRRAYTLNVLEACSVRHSDMKFTENESQLLDYQPIKWGNKTLDFSDSNICFRPYFSEYRRSRDEQRRNEDHAGNPDWQLAA